MARQKKNEYAREMNLICDTRHRDFSVDEQTQSFPIVINARTDGALAEQLIRDGRPIAEPVLLHAPSLELFAFFVPEELQHRALDLWAEFLKNVSGSPAPSYFRRAEVVIGVDELRRAVGDARDRQKTGAGKIPAAQLEATNVELGKATRAYETARATVAELEARIDAMVREQETERQQFESWRLDLEQREEDLDARFERLRRREEQRIQKAHELKTTVGLLSHSDKTQVVDASMIQEVSDEEIDELSMDESVQEVDSYVPPPMEGDDLEIADEDAVESLGDPEEHILDVDGLVELVELDEDQSSDVAELETALEEARAQEKGEVVAPAALLSERDAQMVLLERDGGGIEFAVRLEEGDDEVFSESAELVYQYVEVQERPVFLLSLVDFSEARPFPRRAALDPRNPSQRRQLNLLLEVESVPFSLYSPTGRARGEGEVRLGKRRENLTLALSRADGAKGDLDATTALQRAMAASPPVQLKHPLQNPDGAVEPAGARSDILELVDWMDESKRDLLLLAVSFPVPEWRAAVSARLSAGLQFGVAFPLSLQQALFEVGEEDALLRDARPQSFPDTPELWVETALSNFREVDKKGSLPDVEAARNWEALLAAAESWEVGLDPEIQERALARIGSARGETTAPPASGLTDLSTLSDDSLVDLGGRARNRKAIAVELIRRGSETQMKQASRSMRRMSRQDTLEVIRAFVDAGEGSAGALLDALDARKDYVRQAAAVALGRLGARRAVSPLVTLLRREPTSAWREVAFALGGFGKSALRALESAAKDGDDERVHWALAHVGVTSELPPSDELSDKSEFQSAVNASRGLVAEAAEIRKARLDAKEKAAISSEIGVTQRVLE